MAIKFTWQKLPVDENGRAYDSLDDFKEHLLATLLDATPVDVIPSTLLAKKEEVIEILTLTMDARPTARGKPKPRKSKTAELPGIEPKAA